MAYIYMVSCIDGSLYTGITKDIKRRIAEHLAGSEKSKYTRSHKVCSLVALWECENFSDAAKLEYAIKQLSKSEKNSLIAEPEKVNGLFKNLEEIVFRPLPLFDIKKCENNV